jgi:hypothetical protein
MHISDPMSEPTTNLVMSSYQITTHFTGLNLLSFDGKSALQWIDLDAQFDR